MDPRSAPVGLCRDCFAPFDQPAPRCPACRSPRTLKHRELHALTIAHVDCDAFYAAVEKRDNPSLRDRPVIVGGGKRGVVTTACYIARIYGVRSAMPMFTALKACPDAVVVRPNFDKYVAVGRDIRERMLALTPLVQPISIDEAFLDLTGTQRLHGASAAVTLARFASEVEAAVGITVSVGLAPNRFLAKFASDAEKPRGFTVIGRADAEARLSDEPVGRLPGVGPAAEARLRAAGFRLVGDLQRAPLDLLMRRLGADAARLKRLAHGLDDRAVDPSGKRKSVSAEQTFDADIADREMLAAILRHLSEKVSMRLKANEIAGRTVTLKLKTASFRSLTRARQLSEPTALAHRIFSTGKRLLEDHLDGATRYRLIGIGVSELEGGLAADPPDLVDPSAARYAAAEHAMDALRERFGRDAIELGLTYGNAVRRAREVPPTREG